MPSRRWLLATIALISLLLGATPGAAVPELRQAAWEQWQHQVGIVDLGTRADGTLVAMAAGHLFLVQPSSGAATPFSTGPNGFSADPNAEPYFVVAQPQA